MTSATRGLGMVLIVGALTGCGTWRVDPTSPRQLIEEEGPYRVRVTGSAGPVTITRPRISGDSITDGRSISRGVPLDDVRSIEVERLDGGKTVAAIVGIPFLTYAVAGLLYMSFYNGAP